MSTKLSTRALNVLNDLGFWGHYPNMWKKEPTPSNVKDFLQAKRVLYLPDSTRPNPEVIARRCGPKVSKELVVFMGFEYKDFSTKDLSFRAANVLRSLGVTGEITPKIAYDVLSKLPNFKSVAASEGKTSSFRVQNCGSKTSRELILYCGVSNQFEKECLEKVVRRIGFDKTLLLLASLKKT